MTMRKPLIVLFLALLATLSAGAQGREQIEIVLMDGSTAIFASEGFSTDKATAVDNATQAVLRRLLYDGVEGFNGGEAIVSRGQRSNIWLGNFFTGKYAPYKTYVNGVELIGDFNVSPQGETHCQTHVIIDLDKLMSQCRTQGLMDDGTTGPVQQRTTVPQQSIQRPKRKF